MKYTDSHPAHDRESCSDLYPINVDPAGSHGCARCTALALDALKAALADARDALRWYYHRNCADSLMGFDDFVAAVAKEGRALRTNSEK